MARIRTIKPEFWTDEKLTECSLSARLMFIGMLNFADDNGNIENSAKQLKMRIFPADNIDTQPLIDDLITHGLLIEYSVNGKNYLHIKGFKANQVINRPSKTSIPKPDFDTDHGVLTESSLTEGRGEEGKGREGKGSGEEAENKNPPQPQQENFTGQVMTDLTNQVVDLYEKTFGLGLVRGTQTLMTIGQRAMQYPKAQNPEWWGAFFDEVSADDFLSGRKPKTDGKPFELTLNYLLKEEVFQSIIERSQRRSMAHA